MRKLLLLFVGVLTSVGAWADDYYKSYDTWFNSVPDKMEQVVKIKIETPGSLATALATVDQSQYGVMFINVVDGKYLNDADIAALSSVTCPTLDLQYAWYTADKAAFTFTNSSVRNLILPDGWTKAEVQACAANLGSSLGSAISQQVISDSEAGLVAYVQVPGSLRETMEHCFLDNKTNTKLGNPIGPYGQQFTKIKYASFLGYPAARDFNGNISTAGLNFDENGHFHFNVAADETKMVLNAGVGGVSRALVGTRLDGALGGASLISLDLEDAIIYERYCEDLTLSWSHLVSDITREIKFPTTPELMTIPADCLCGSFKSLDEICIPGNIQILRTRSFYTSNGTIRHIWTTGTGTSSGEDHTVYDNGAFIKGGESHLGHAPLDDSDWNNEYSTKVRYGTITLSANIKLIESHVFQSEYVSDVYSLGVKAPECHVDAFASVMYMGNNTIDGTVDGMITRESYAVDTDAAKYISFLHYPRESTTPDIQRYTDPTREYHVATTLRDAKGNIIYFPNQSELNRAFYQGTTGYLWYAWDSEREPEFYNNAHSFKNADITGDFGHTNSIQEAANKLYRDNTYTTPDKTDRSFYDVRLDQDEQPTLTMPDGLKWYYNTIWETKQLYPERKTFTTDVYYYTDPHGDYVLDGKEGFRLYKGSADDAYIRYSILRGQATDADGNLQYEACTDGNFVQNYSYVENEAGALVHDVSIAADTEGSLVLDYEYQAAEDGQFYHPFETVAAPNDVWNDDYTPSDYYYPTGRYDKDSDGDWCDVYGNWIHKDNIPSWAADQFASEWAAGNRYTFNITGFTACNSREDVSNHSALLYKISGGYAEYSDDVTDYYSDVNDTRYNKVYFATYRDYNEDTDAGETRYTRTDNGYRDYAGSEDDGLTRYDKVYDGTYRAVASTDDSDEPRYCPKMEDVKQASSYLVANDYRGWHQFILTAYGKMDDNEYTTVKFYQTDNDWWTVCLPYDLRYDEMIRFFGNGTSNKPYLSKLRYVVRDYDQQKITLMFSKNLMEYKEQIANAGYVHGAIDDNTPYSADELEANPVILHAGVPYLIRPNIDVNAGRSFDVYKNSSDDLYDRLVQVETLGSDVLNDYIYKGEYTVPAYVIGEDTEENTVDSRAFTHKDGPTMTYTSSDVITYQGKEISAPVSSDFSYTFVGTFFLSVLPENCYFLGWDSSKRRAAFWYNRVTNKLSLDWNNQTGVICSNFDTSATISAATSLSDPARWKIETVANDDLLGSENASKANTLAGMDWGGKIDMVVDGIGAIKASSDAHDASEVVYDLQGVRLNQSVGNLPKGVYIVNGKKYVVK